MKKALVGIVFFLISSFTQPAWADEFYILRDLATQKCTVVDKRPTTNTMTITLADDAIYTSRADAEAAIKTIKVCLERK
jgi:hypothetical protein